MEHDPHKLLLEVLISKVGRRHLLVRNPGLFFLLLFELGNRLI